MSETEEAIKHLKLNKVSETDGVLAELTKGLGGCSNQKHEDTIKKKNWISNSQI